MRTTRLPKPFAYLPILVLFLIPTFIQDPYILHVLIMSGIAVILASSLRVVANTGLLSLGQGGLMSMGAYTSALVVMKLGFSTWAGLALGAVVAGLTALAVGFPFVRIKGMYFALVTVFLAEIIRIITEQWKDLTGGSFGIQAIPKPEPIVIPGLLNITFTSKENLFYLVLILTLFTLLVLYILERSRINMAFLSIQQADFLAESVGMNKASLKVLAFVIGCTFAGLAGAFYSQYMAVITPSTFAFLYNIYIFIYVAVGGMKRFSGPIVGAIVLTFLPEAARVLKEYQPYLFVAVTMLTVYFMPEGLVGLPQRIRQLYRKVFKNAGDQRLNQELRGANGG